MYIFSFFKRITRKSNIPVFFYLILNVLFICGIFHFLLGKPLQAPFWMSSVAGLVLYAISLTLALSPIGEWIIRMENGCRKIKRAEQREFLMPLFDEVYARAKEEDPTLRNNIRLFICSDKSANAFAVGRKTICVTEGLLSQSEEEIKAVLAHEFGHISHKDTDLIQLVCAGNVIVTTIILMIRVLCGIFHLMFAPLALLLGEGLGTILFGDVLHVLTTALIGALMWVWTEIGALLVLKSSRSNEYLADEFSFDLGYGDSLCEFLDSFDEEAPKGAFAVLSRTHPHKDDRIARLQELGAAYRASYGKK